MFWVAREIVKLTLPGIKVLNISVVDRPNPSEYTIPADETGLEEKSLSPVVGGGRIAREQWDKRTTVDEIGNLSTYQLREGRGEVDVDSEVLNEVTARNTRTPNDQRDSNILLIGRVFSCRQPVLSEVKAVVRAEKDVKEF